MYSNPSLSQHPAADRFAMDSLQQPRVTMGKDRMSAWQRWEMTSLSDELRGAQDQALVEPEVILTAVDSAPLIDEVELARLRRQAEKLGEEEGYRRGYEQGQAAGYQAGMTAAQEQADHLRALAQSLPAALRMAERDVSSDLLALALDIARQVVGQALDANPDVVLATVRVLLQDEPALTGSPQLILHPLDAALVKEHLAEDLQTAGWRVRIDPVIQRGGCRVLASNGEKDATLPTRWERVTTALAQLASPAA